MSQGNTETIFTLNKQPELKAIEDGLNRLSGQGYAQLREEIFHAGHALDYDDIRHRPWESARPPYKRVRNPKLQVTQENIQHIVDSLENTISCGGLLTIVQGKKRMARRILQLIEDNSFAT